MCSILVSSFNTLERHVDKEVDILPLLFLGGVLQQYSPFTQLYFRECCPGPDAFRIFLTICTIDINKQTRTTRT